MSKQTKDLVAAAHQAFAMDEISLKQLAILFNRITIQGLWLAELGIRFEIEKEKLNVSDNDDYKKAFTLILEDANEILQSGWLALTALKDLAKLNSLRCIVSCLQHALCSIWQFARSG